MPEKGLASYQSSDQVILQINGRYPACPAPYQMSPCSGERLVGVKGQLLFSRLCSTNSRVLVNDVGYSVTYDYAMSGLIC